MHARKTRQRKKEHMTTLRERADELKEEVSSGIVFVMQGCAGFT